MPDLAVIGEKFKISTTADEIEGQIKEVQGAAKAARAVEKARPKLTNVNTTNKDTNVSKRKPKALPKVSVLYNFKSLNTYILAFVSEKSTSGSNYYYNSGCCFSNSRFNS